MIRFRTQEQSMEDLEKEQQLMRQRRDNLKT